MSPGSALVLLAAVGIVALDILVASPWTGLPVVLVMLIVTLAVAEQVRQIIASRGGTAGLAGVLWFEASLLLALLGFLVARVFVLTEMFGGATERQIAAAETYILVFMGLAATAGSLAIAPERSGRALLRLAQKPATMLISSFAAMILVGSLLLILPLSVTHLGHVTYVDALFTMTTLTEERSFIRLMFEAVSALATVGLSTGLTATLSVAGKLIVSAAMFLGRVGPFTIALAIGDKPGRQRYRLAREGLPVG